MKKTIGSLAVVCLFLAPACATRIPPPRTVKENLEPPERAWARVLSKHVNDKGQIDFAGIARDPSDLAAYLSWVARVSPDSTPESFSTSEAKLAYYVNAYNGLAMYDVIHSNFPAKIDKVKKTFFYTNRFEMGGRYVSLYGLENSTIRPIGDPRVHFALNCMARSCPRLPRQPFSADTLNAAFDREARYFFAEERNVSLEPAKKTVRVSQILQFYEKDFLTKAPSLIAYANMYRNEKIPADWKVEFIPYDWTLNKESK
ncbi:MAG: DUF547 domain-containing protein [Acidobacteriota bacterium]|nr:DUF547 domain-containing protein [Acidobacteriota bacterium]